MRARWSASSTRCYQATSVASRRSRTLPPREPSFRAIALDYDRTLTAPDGDEPTADALAALRAARRDGARVIIVSGRDVEFLVARVGRIADAIVAENGALLLAPADAEPARVRDASDELRRALDALAVPIERGRVIASFDATHEPLVREALVGVDAELVRNRDRIMVLPSGLDKAVGLLAALDALGIDASECVAFGDGENDAPMLRAVGLGVAVGNAVAELRAAADEVAPGAGGHAVAAWLDARDRHARRPFVSVVVPCRDEGGTLEACIAALLAQSYPGDRFEVLVVDGGSTDGSHELARDAGARVRVMHDAGSGPSGARNVGIRAARGEIVAFTDADCVPARDWLSRLVDTFVADPGLAGVAGGLRMRRASLVGRFEDADARVNYGGWITSNVAYRRDILLAVGGFDEDIVCAEDSDLAWRVLDAGHRIGHERKAVVMHDPPEVNDTLTAYLQKQFWYARSDVATHVRALRAGRRRALPGFSNALAEAACVGAVALVPLVGWRVGALGLATIGAQSLARTTRTARAAGESMWDAPGMLALDVAKRVVRGAGTLAGLAELALSPAAARPPQPAAGQPVVPPPRAPSWLHAMPG